MSARRWRLEVREVVSGYAAKSDPGTRLAALPEGADVRKYNIWLEHRPTGLAVEGSVPEAQLDSRQLQLIEIEIRKALFAELELKVGRHLGKTGR